MEKFRKKLDWFWLVALLVAFLISSFIENAVWAASEDDIQNSISSIEKKIDKEQAEKKRLEQELMTIQNKAGTTQAEINKTKSLIQQAQESIARKEQEIKLMEGKIKIQQEILSGLLRETYYNKKDSPLAVILSQSEFLKVINQFDSLTILEQKMVSLSDEIQSSRDKVSKDKEELKETEEDHQKLLALKEDQQQDLLAEKKETQGDIAQKEATIGELQGKLSKLRSELSGLLGKSYNAKDIEAAASFASKKTGVRKDFILGMLVVESDLGRFTGGCYAKDSRMSSYRLEIFKKICAELKYDWKNRKVSCPPRGYKGTGGAMGVAQFMSDTWMGYKSSIASNTGHNPPDPWNLTDGVMGMALKLARGGATKKSGECNAAKLYLSGTTSSKYNWYCQKVLYWANNYERLLGN